MAEWASVAVCSEASKSTKRCSAGQGAGLFDPKENQRVWVVRWVGVSGWCCEDSWMRIGFSDFLLSAYSFFFFF